MAFRPACVARIFVGAGRPGRSGRYRGFDTSIDGAEFRRKVEAIVRRYFPTGSTDFQARGTWRDTATGESTNEQSVVVEVWQVGGNCKTHLARAWKVARALARTFGQQACGVIGDDGSGQTVADFVRQSGGQPWPHARRGRSRRRRVA